MSVTSTGTGTLTLGSAVTGFQSFASAGVANSDVVSYVIEDGANWEVGTGTYTSSGTTLSRTVSASSNSNSEISVTTNAQVYVTALAADIVNTANNLSDLASASTARTNLGVAIGTNVQAWDGDLDAIAALAGTSGLLKKTDANTWSLDTTSYLSGNVSLTTGVTGTLPVGNGGTGATTLTGVVKGNGTSAFTAATAGTDYISPSVTANVTKGFTVTPNSISTGNFTVDPALGNYQYVTNNGAYTITAPASDCAVDILVTNGASAGATTFSGFTVGSSTGSALTTTNTNKFLISVRRINSISTYSIYALQ
jgi:hypothetical protein